jgi:hypothetical protein
LIFTDVSGHHRRARQMPDTVQCVRISQACFYIKPLIYIFLDFPSHVYVRGLTNNARCSVSAKKLLRQAREKGKPSSPLQIKALSNFVNGPGQLSRYSDWLRSRRSGDQIPVEARISAPVQTGPGAHPALYRMGTGSLTRG